MNNKLITPMNRLKGQFSELTSFLASDFNLLLLQESKSKEIPYPFQPKDLKTGDYKYRTKGVQEDYLKIYNDQNSDVNFAFIFEYKEKDEKDWKIFVSIKTNKDNESIVYSEPYNFIDFKNSLNLFVSELRTKSLSKNKKDRIDAGNVFNLVSTSFLKTTFDLKKEIKKAEDTINKALGDISIKINENQKKIEEVNKNILDINTILSKSIPKTKEYQELQEIKKRMTVLEDILEQKKVKIESENNKSEKLELLKNLKEEKKSLNKQAITETIEIKKKLPNAVSKRIKP